MHFFTSNGNGNDGLSAADRGPASLDDAPPAGQAALSGEDGGELDHQPSITIAPDPVIDRYHDHLDDDGEADVQLGQNNRTSRGVSTSPPSDSGYGSSPVRGRQPSVLRPAHSTTPSMKSIPILWSADANNGDNNGPPSFRGADRDEAYARRGTNANTDSPVRRATSLRSFRSNRDSARSTSGTHRRRVSLSGGSFAAGAGTIGPASTLRADDTASFHARSRSAEAELTPKQRTRIAKANAKEDKRVVKVIKREAKAEAKALEQATRELSDIQRMQKTALKEEARAGAQHAKALRQFHKDELEYLAAVARYERAATELRAFENKREAAREHAEEVAEMLKEKNKEVEWLRAQKAADDRERGAKVRQLTGKE